MTKPETVTLLCSCSLTRNCGCGECDEDTLVIVLCAPHEYDHGDPEWQETHGRPRNAAGCSCIICEIRDDAPDDDIEGVDAVWAWVKERA